MMFGKIESPIQREIISMCRFWKDGARYSQLKIKKLENDLFNYHLQHLVKSGFLRKQNNLYVLTPEGKSLVTNIDEEDKGVPPAFKVSVCLCPIIGKKVLLYRRRKHPQYGYAGLISGKIRFGENILSAAKREFKEETNLSADFSLVGNLRQIRRNRKAEVIEDGMFYVCLTNKINGKLGSKGKEGDYFWTGIESVGNIEKLFKPSVEMILKELSNRTAFVFELEPEPEEY